MKRNTLKCHGLFILQTYRETPFRQRDASDQYPSLCETRETSLSFFSLSESRVWVCFYALWKRRGWRLLACTLMVGLALGRECSRHLVHAVRCVCMRTCVLVHRISVCPSTSLSVYVCLCESPFQHGMRTSPTACSDTHRQTHTLTLTTVHFVSLKWTCMPKDLCTIAMHVIGMWLPQCLGRNRHTQKSRRSSRGTGLSKGPWQHLQGDPMAHTPCLGDTAADHLCSQEFPHHLPSTK